MHIYTSFLSDGVRIQNEKLAIVIKRHQITLYQLFPATGGKQTFGKVSFPSKNKRFQRLVSNRKTKVSPAEVSIELKTNEALFSRKVCFGTEKKGFLKRFVSTLKTNYALNRSKQTFTGKQTKKPRWKKVCFQGFQTLWRQVCLEF